MAVVTTGRIRDLLETTSDDELIAGIVSLEPAERSRLVSVLGWAVHQAGDSDQPEIRFVSAGDGAGSHEMPVQGG